MDCKKPTPSIAASSIKKRQPLRVFLPPIIQSFYIQFFTGTNDGCVGVLIPSIKTYYGLSQSVVSLLFLCYALGYVIAAVTYGIMVKKITLARTAMVGSFCVTLGFFLVSFILPFPATCVFFVIIGIGAAIVQSSANVICGEMSHATMMLNLLHASFGLGALIGPFIATAVLQRWTWNYAYYILCGMASLNALTIIISFRHLRIAEERDHRNLGMNPDLEATAVEFENDQHSIASCNTSHSTVVGDRFILFDIIRYRIVYVGALFLVFYVGVEVSIGDWAYTFLISERSSDSAGMSHIMSGYWAGLCFGRLCLGYISDRFGEKRTVFIYLSVLIAMIATLWLVPLVAINATVLVIMGISLGPMFPTVIAIANHCIPTHLYASAVGFLAACGSSGSALFPYITGVLIGKAGVKSMPPFAMAMSCVLFVTWIFIPSPSSSLSFEIFHNAFRRFLPSQKSASTA